MGYEQIAFVKKKKKGKEENQGQLAACPKRGK